ARAALLTLFSGVLEFNNLFASYKGEGTGAVRHMFSHHILKPERTPTEVNGTGTAKGRICSPPFAGQVEDQWPGDGRFAERAVYLSSGDSAATGLPAKSIDLVVTDPPFFDNVHYSELADFFHAWQQLAPNAPPRQGHDHT